MSHAPDPAPARRRPVPLIVRDAEAGLHADLFLVCAVATILGVRGLLAATGYPQLGGRHLHIAHMLWGGLAMALALGLVLLSLNRRVRPLAAIVGGVGFGLFLDELGKFLTRDNDYFYQPTIALIYLVFVLLFLAVRRLLSQGALTTDERLANALTLLRDMALEDLDEREKSAAAAHLARCAPGDPRVALVRGFLEQLTPASPAPPPRYARLRRRADRAIERVLRHPRFPRALSALFVVQALAGLLFTVLTARLLWRGWRDPGSGPHLEHAFAEWARLLSGAASLALVLAGVVRLLGDPARAYRLFRLSLLVSLFVTQFFVFYVDQLAGVAGLAFNLVLLAGVEFLLGRERRLGQPPASAGPG